MERNNDYNHNVDIRSSQLGAAAKDFKKWLALFTGWAILVLVFGLAGGILLTVINNNESQKKIELGKIGAKDLILDSAV